MPDGLDILFLSTPTQHAALAYALATIFRRRGVRVVLAGPHARAFPEDCARFGDVVVTTCDRALVEDKHRTTASISCTSAVTGRCTTVSPCSTLMDAGTWCATGGTAGVGVSTISMGANSD